MVRSLVILGFLATGLSQAFADDITVQGRINFYDCSGVLVRPAQSADEGKCVVAYSGRSYLKGTINNFQGNIGLMDAKLNPEGFSGKNVRMVVDLKTGEIRRIRTDDGPLRKIYQFE